MSCQYDKYMSKSAPKRPDVSDPIFDVVRDSEEPEWEARWKMLRHLDKGASNFSFNDDNAGHLE